MTKVAFSITAGARPGTSPEKLPSGYAQAARNCTFESGVPAPVEATTVYKTVVQRGARVRLYKHGDRFLTFTRDVDVIESPIADADGRFVWTDGTLPKQSNDALAFGGSESGWPTSYRRLGMDYPPDPLTITLVGEAGENIAHSVSYTYTYLNDLGEESATAYPTGVTEVYDDQTVRLSGFGSAPQNDHITGYRIYRIENNIIGLVGETSLVQSFLDTMDDVIDTCATETWIAPPDDMQGLVLTSSGIAVGFSGKQIVPSEPFTIYAYPEGYRQVVDHDIVALGTSGTTVFVLTEKNPYLLSGTAPESLTLQRIAKPQSCIAKRSVVSMSGGCIYASPDGLILLDVSGGDTLLTDGIYSKTQWKNLSPENIVGCLYDGDYFAFFVGSSQAIQFSLGEKCCIMHDMPGNVLDVMYDAVDDAMYILLYEPGRGYRIYTFRSGAEDGQQYTVTTRMARMAAVTNFACGRIIGDISSDRPVTISVTCDGVQVFQKTLDNPDPFRLPGGFGVRSIEATVTGTARITAIEFATSVQELTHG